MAGYANHWDWRDRGVLFGPAPTQNGSTCWAHAVGATVEASFQKQGNLDVAPSVQELIDCCDVKGGVNGGRVMDAFRHIKRKRVTNSDEYPLLPISGPARCTSRGTCNICNDGIVPRVSITNFKMIGDISVVNLMRQVRGRPLVVNACVGDTFYCYSRGDGVLIDGIYPFEDEYLNIRNHSMVMIGYGTEG